MAPGIPTHHETRLKYLMIGSIGDFGVSGVSILTIEENSGFSHGDLLKHSVLGSRIESSKRFLWRARLATR